jgi:hypothetical protein
VLRDIHTEGKLRYQEAYMKNNLQGLQFYAGFLNAIETAARNLGEAL